ncbi:hypothetical protein ACFCWV_34590 [Streptomyces sp. NPDC056341]|uniref:hypothetical protein n=1 Tax=Streptomyces sp. NPDC056341 TaxID=3345788 RepID=UPI0035D5D9C3
MERIQNNMYAPERQQAILRLARESGRGHASSASRPSSAAPGMQEATWSTSLSRASTASGAAGTVISGIEVPKISVPA